MFELVTFRHVKRKHTWSGCQMQRWVGEKVRTHAGWDQISGMGTYQRGELETQHRWSETQNKQNKKQMNKTKEEQT